MRDAGALLPTLNRLVRADCTTRNLRKAARLSAAYDDLEERIFGVLLVITMPPAKGNEPPDKLVPLPRATNGSFSAWQNRTSAMTSSCVSGTATASAALIERIPSSPVLVVLFSTRLPAPADLVWDTVKQTDTLRYLLVRPVSRLRVLLAKLVSVVAFVVIVVAGLLERRAKVEIEATAVIPS